MAITNYIGDRIVGPDEDLALTNATDGTLFITSDTLKVYLRSAGAWEEIDISLSLNGLMDVEVTGATSGDFIRFDGDDWVNTLLSASDIPNLDASKITSGTFSDSLISQSSVVQHEGALSITESQISDLGNYLENINNESIGDLSDVVIVSPAGDEVLAYDSATSEWKNVELSAIVPTIDELNDIGDVTISTPTADQVIAYNAISEEWENVDIEQIVPTIDELNDIGNVSITSASDGQSLVFEDGSWINKAITLEDDLVSSGSPTTNWDVIRWDGVAEEWTITNASTLAGERLTWNSSTGAFDVDSIPMELDELEDVTITTPSDRHALLYDNVAEEWVNRSIVEADISDLGNYLEDITGENLGDLSNVNVSTASNGEFLQFNGTNWVSHELQDTDIPDLSSEYQVLSEKGEANGYAPLDANVKIPTQYLPALAITEVFVVADITERDELPVGSGEGEVQEGDVAVVNDASGDPNVDSGPASYIYDGTVWVKLRSPDESVVGAAGNNTEVQFNSFGEFDASPSFTFDSDVLGLEGHLELSENSSLSAPTLSSGEARMYTVTGTEGTDNYTRTMLKMGGQEYIVSTYIE